MKVTTPHMGTVDLLLADLFYRFETDYSPPPKTSNETLRLGVKCAPEFACLPLKINIGNFIEGLEKGADTLVMAGGIGPCRFGYYSQIQKRIIADLGYDFEMITIEPPGVNIWNFIAKFKYLAPKKSIWQIYQALKLSFAKAQAIDEIEREVLKSRAYETEKRATTKAYKKAIKLLEKAYTKQEISKAKEQALGIISEVKKDLSRRPLKIGIVGEFYMLLEPYVNFDIEEYLGQKDIYLERAVYLTDWIGLTDTNPVGGISDEELAAQAQGYLSHFVGGEGQATIGNIVRFAKQGFDGIIHLLPFTCMPETIAKSIFPKLSRELDLPILSLTIDEQTAKAGVVTRLEAFIDLLYSKRKQASMKNLN